MDDAARLKDEIIRIGGERKLKDLLDAEREIWNLQSLVVSHYRETGLIHKAILLAKTTVETEQQWYAYDREYRQRRDLAGVQFAETLVAPYLTKAQNGELTNATLLGKIWAQYDPSKWGPEDKKDEDAGLRELDLMRQLNAEWRKAQELEKELVAYKGGNPESVGDEPITIDNVDEWLASKAIDYDDDNPS